VDAVTLRLFHVSAETLPAIALLHQRGGRGRNVPTQGEDLLLQPWDLCLFLSGNTQQFRTELGVVHLVSMLCALHYSVGFCTVGSAQVLKQRLAAAHVESRQKIAPAAVYHIGNGHQASLFFL
jgi:hypothetical protein